MRDDYDEEGEPVYDPDEPQSREGSSEEEEWQDSPSASPAREVSPKAKSRKRLVKKSTSRVDDEYDEPEGEDRPRKRKSRDLEDDDDRPRARKSKEGREGKEEGKKGRSGSIAAKLSKLAKSGGGKSEGRSGRSGGDRPQRNRDRREERETWARNEGQEGDSEEDGELEPTPADDNFIDDTGVEHEGYSDDGGVSPSHHPEAEEAEEEEQDELNKFFKSGKKRKNKNERSSEEIAMFVEQFMAKLDVAAEADADLNRASKPAIEKLKMLPELLTVLEKRQLQQEFLDRGVLSSLKNWLEPLPDGSLPNMNIRSALLKLLTDLPIDVELTERREQLKKSGLGKVVMFLSKLSEETPGNKKLARDLVDKWSRPIFQKSTRYEDLKQYDDERPLPRRLPQPAKKPAAKTFDATRDGDELEMGNDTGELKPGDPGYRYHASRPQAMPLDFVVRPASKIDAEDLRNRAKQLRMDERRAKMDKKLQLLRATKRKNLQAARLSVEGRGVVSYR
ncbi:hypothetical protein R1flu_006136 [Riccia fluitans]|uniref:TFIIS N-terminal domain-containing protein n=1 Tax=Riccia fluitans TaxID=41844 RepID=A0ABD1YZ77_9MARC